MLTGRPLLGGINGGELGFRTDDNAIEAASLMAPLGILHVLRTPVGGLFRHVLDLARGQVARGHRVGLIMDADSGGPQADAAVAALAPSLALGLTRHSMRRAPGLADLGALWHVRRRIAATGPDVLHGHGAKGGAYARIAAYGHAAIRVYTPHGGSLHYDRATLAGRVYLTAEQWLMARTDLVTFESAYSDGVFRTKIGVPSGLARVVHNGVAAAEFAPVPLAANVADLLFVGELRHLKGVDVLIDAIANLRGQGRALTATIVGAGAERAVFERQASLLGLAEAIRFAGAMPARQAFANGRVLVVPSRAESLPYVVLEAAAAGKPVIATRVGGIAEIFGPDAGRLVPADDAAALANAIAAALDRPDETGRAAASLRGRVAEGFTVDGMVEGVLAAYREALAARRR